MKYVIVFLIFIIPHVTTAQPDSLYVSGRFIYNHYNEQIILKGVNYSVLDDWDFPANMNNGNERLVEIEKSNANTVRIQWYNNYGQPSRPTYNLVHLDSLLTRCARFKMVPVVGLWDMTCSNDWSNFNSRIVNWWLQPAVIALYQKHKRYSIVNLANEFGHYVWTGNTATAITTFKNNYKTAITALRNAGYVTPIMIDAPDCGTNADALINAGTDLLAHDPLHNIILSVHTYWYGQNINDATSINHKLTQIQNSGLPFMLGEIANYQDDPNPCQYLLNYSLTLTAATQKNIGWLAWTWFKDNCAQRMMAPNGLFTNLNTYGSDLVYNTTYGLAATAVRNPNTFAPPTTILPVQKLELSAVCSGNNTRLIADYTLDGNYTISIEQSNNGQRWKNILQQKNVRGTGNLYLVTTETSGFYRCVATSENNNLSYSPVAYCKNSGTVQFAPNPNRGSFQIFNNIIYNRLQIQDIQGKPLFGQSLQNGQSTIVTNLQPGIYLLRLSGNKSGTTHPEKLYIIQ